MWRLKQWLSRRPQKLFRLLQRGPRLSAIWHSYEKAGLRVSDEPIAWNADAVIVEALLEWSGKPLNTRNDFELHISGEAPVRPTFVEACDPELYHIVFRLMPYQRSRIAVIHWRSRPIGVVELPYLSRETFLQVQFSLFD